MPRPLDAALQRYIKFYETLTPETLDSINDVFMADARFKDPFNDVRGVAHIRKIFADMFKTVGAPDFTISSYGWSDNPVHATLINREGLPASPFETRPW